jgi:hypothetical protein
MLAFFMVSPKSIRIILLMISVIKNKAKKEAIVFGF